MKKSPIGSLLAFIFFLIICSSGCKKESDPVSEIDQNEKINLIGLSNPVKKAHPRLLLTEQRLQELKTLSLTDDRLKKYINDVISQANKDLSKAPIEHILIGPRLLDKSRECLSRVYNLSFTYRWTSDVRYLNAAVSNMKTVCAYADWNPSHFLDVAEMTHAVAIGYDWLYNKMDEQSRITIKAGLIKLGLEEGKKAYTANQWWTKDAFNWNQVCNSGLLIGALAVAETDPGYTTFILPKAIANLPFALKTYGPAGVWGEGPGYWDYATSYTAYGISALQTALENTFELTNIKGMAETGYFPIYSAGPSGLMLNYADAGENSKLGAPSAAMWLANVFSNNHFSDFIEDQLISRSANVHHIIWYRPYASSAAKRDLDKYFDGEVPLFFSRSSWTEPDAFFLGAKAGDNQVNHAHLDIGNFEFDALGIRWARDLGSDDYNLPDYFGSLRWTYYRLNSLSHNVPVIDGKIQDLKATSKFIKHSEGTAEPFSILDFTEAYKEFSSAAKRGFEILDNRKVLLIQDEFTITKTCSIVWGMTTNASIQIINPQKAELTENGKKLTARILSPNGAIFTSGSAQQAKPQKENLGVNRLLASCNASIGNTTIIVLLLPQWGGVENSFNPQILELSKW